jgi:outer membrane autotransporter protein
MIAGGASAQTVLVPNVPLVFSTTGSSANTVTTAGNGIVDVASTVNYTLSGVVSGAGSVSQVGAGNLILSGANTYTNLGINAGTVTFGSNTAGGIGAIAINNNATLASGAAGLVVGNQVVTTANGIINAGATGNTFTINGVVSGNGSISQVGTGNLVLNGNNTFRNLGINQGTVTLGNNNAAGIGAIAINNNATLAAGTSGLVVANGIATTGAGTINSGTGTFTLSGVISNSGSITKTGTGTLILSGNNTYTGATTVAAGTLQVTGNNGPSTVTAASGGTLAGTGSVANVVVANGGTIAPGNNGLGTLAINGTLTQASGGVYNVQLGANNASDRIATGGSATLASGAVLNVINTTSSPLVLNSRYTVLSTGAAGLTGTYTLTNNRVSQFIDAVASYDARNVYLNVRQTRTFASAAATENQAAAAFGADRPGSSLYQALAYQTDAASAQFAFDQISGELHASLNSATFEDSRFVREAIYGHTADQFMPGMGLWVAGFGSWGAANSDGNASGYDRSIGGFFLGFDALKTDTASVGILTGYSTADVNIPELGSSASTDDLYVGLYGSYDIAGFSLTGAITNTWRWVGTHRQINFVGYSDYARADYSINTFQVFGEAAYQFRFSGIGIEPYANFAYISVSSDAFQEFGGAAALFADEDGGSDYWATQLGLRASYGLPVWGDTFSLTASAGWRYVFEGDTLSPVTMRFGNGPDFTVLGAPIAQNAIATSFDISKKLGDRADASIGYSGQYGDGWHDNGLRASVRLRF